MALIAMCVYDPPGESRHQLLSGALDSLANTVDFSKHRLFIVDNGTSLQSEDEINGRLNNGDIVAQVIHNGENRGTARACNQSWQLRISGEHCLKIDSDVVIHEAGWLDKLEECIARDPQIGQVALKRPDLAENPWSPVGDWSHSDLKMLPHKPGESWLTVEVVRHCMGTCVLHSSALLDKVGYLYQMGAAYGFDDGDMSARSECAGFYNCFYGHYRIDHPDEGGGEYQKFKERVSGANMDRFLKMRRDYQTGKLPLYRGPDEP